MSPPSQRDAHRCLSISWVSLLKSELYVRQTSVIQLQRFPNMDLWTKPSLSCSRGDFHLIATAATKLSECSRSTEEKSRIVKEQVLLGSEERDSF